MTFSQVRSPRGAQKGAVLIFVLIALALLLIGGVAMVRSMNVTLFNAGNYAFKRDLVNQSERAVDAAYTSFGSGALAVAAVREKALVSANYSGALLPSNPQGIPMALLDDAEFAKAGLAANDIKVDPGVVIRYVVDRLCASGHEGPANQTVCTMAGPGTIGVSTDEQINATQNTTGGQGASSLQPVYRISVRVIGPRGTESYFQSTFAI
jgi:type IV pilus assembly protein PilX